MDTRIPSQVSAGDQVSAKLFNKLIAGVNQTSGVRGAGAIKFGGLQQLVVKCQNDSGVTLKRGEVVRFYEGLYTPSIRRQAAFNVKNLQGGSGFVPGAIGIALEPIFPETAGDVCFSGICAARLRKSEPYNVGDRLDATTNPGLHGQVLERAAFGTAQLLSLDIDDEAEWWADVRLDGKQADLLEGTIVVPDPLPDPLLPITRDSEGPFDVSVDGIDDPIEAYSSHVSGVHFYGDNVILAGINGRYEIVTPGRQVLNHCKIVDATASEQCGQALYNVDVYPFCDTPPQYKVVAFDPLGNTFTADQRVILSVDPGLFGTISIVTYCIIGYGCHPPVEEEEPE